MFDLAIHLNSLDQIQQTSCYAPNTLTMAFLVKISEYHKPVFKKGTCTSRPISTLSVFPNIFERLLGKQLLQFFDYILSRFQGDFRKGYETQHCLLLMLEIWKGATDNKKAFGAFLTDLSNA